LCAEFENQGLAPGTIKTIHGDIRKLLWSIGTGTACLAGIPRTAPRKPREQTVSDLEFEQVYKVAKAGLQLVMLLARDAGLRHAAIWNITSSNCDFHHRIVHGKTKASSNYNCPMTQRLYERLLFVCAQALDSQEPLLAQFMRRRRKPDYYAISNWLLTHKKDLGIVTPWGLHDLRRSGARALYERTHDLRKVQRFLSHAHMAQSCWYMGDNGTDINPEDLETPCKTPEQKKKSA
jgi:site-specific recombinase XerC